MDEQEPIEEMDETVFGADFKVLEPTGKGKAPKIKDRPASKKKTPAPSTKPTKTPTGKGSKAAPSLGYRTVSVGFPSTIDHPFNW
jgi:hypothetical protein